jgi:SagB-type dehydrogenase family enzyme
MRTPEHDRRILSMLYHHNSEPWIHPEAYTRPYEVEYREDDGGVALPAAQDSALLGLLRKRASCRDFSGAAVSLDAVATFLFGAYGLLRKRDDLPSGPVFHRSSPSAGGLYPLEIYMLAQHVTGLARGVYRYNVRGHHLAPHANAPQADELAYVLCHQPVMGPAAAVFFLAAYFERSEKKYGPRAYRHALIEAGHVAQTMCLLAAEQDFGTLCVGGFYDSKLNAVLKLDGSNEAVLYCVGIGLPSGSEKTSK